MRVSGQWFLPGNRAGLFDIVIPRISRVFAEAAPEAGIPADSPLGRQLGGVSLQQFLTIDKARANRLTTTKEGEGNYYGLHLDNWGGLVRTVRHYSQRRIGFNLGPGRRHLVVASPDALEIADQLGIPDDQPVRTATALRPYASDPYNRAKMRCLWFPLEPGDGYIAPTEIMVHDGSTWGAKRHSRIAFWLGHWPVGLFGSKF
jgi:hypothetical protein